jgi:hypothetical protein
MMDASTLSIYYSKAVKVLKTETKTKWLAILNCLAIASILTKIFVSNKVTK